MVLLIDNRNQLGSSPGMHVLLVGISDYTHLPETHEEISISTFKLRKLQCAARSAYSIYTYLNALDHCLVVPIKTLRILVAPSELEIENEPVLADVGAGVRWQDFRDEVKLWREDCSKLDDDVSFFYFAGHGLQSGHNGPLLLMQDFGADPLMALSATVNFDELFDGMSVCSDVQQLARQQYYFVDCCRRRAREHAQLFDTDAEQLHQLKLLMKPPTFWDVFDDFQRNSADDRHAPVLLAAPCGGEAYGESGGTTFFSQRLIQSLNDQALCLSDDGNDWQVDSFSLGKAMCRAAKGPSDTFPAQSVDLAGTSKASVSLLKYRTPPHVRRNLKVVPDRAWGCTKVTYSPSNSSSDKERYFFPTKESDSIEVTLELVDHRFRGELFGLNAETARTSGCRDTEIHLSKIDLHAAQEIVMGMC